MRETIYRYLVHFSLHHHEKPVNNYEHCAGLLTGHKTYVTSHWQRGENLSRLIIYVYIGRVVKTTIRINECAERDDQSG